MTEERFDPNDTSNAFTKIMDGTAPCNIHATIKNILERLEVLESK
jgi:hypothetical protein